MSNTIKGFRGKDGPIWLDYGGVANIPGAVKSITELEAAVGDHFEVASVDDSGRVATVKAVAKPTGGGELPADPTFESLQLGGETGVSLYPEGTATAPALTLYGTHGDDPVQLNNVADATDDRSVPNLGQVKRLIGSGDYADMYIGPDEPAGDDRPLYWLDTGSAEDSDAVYAIVNRLSNATTDNAAAEIDSGSPYRATLTAADGYVLASVVVMMGGVNVTSEVYSGGVISIPAVTGNVRIAVTTTATGGGTVIHTITNKLTNVSSDNGAVSVEAGAAYTANLTADDGYTMTGAAVTVLMGGEDVTGTAYASGVVSIAAVTGDLEITAAAAKKNDLFDEANVYKSNAANTALEVTKDELDAIEAEKLYYLVNLSDQYKKKMTITARFTPSYGSTKILDAIGIAAANDGTYAFITAGYDCYASDGYVVFEIDIPALKRHIQGMIDDGTLDTTKGTPTLYVSSYNVPAGYMHYLLYNFTA